MKQEYISTIYRPWDFIFFCIYSSLGEKLPRSGGPGTFFCQDAAAEDNMVDFFLVCSAKTTVCVFTRLQNPRLYVVCRCSLFLVTYWGTQYPFLDWHALTVSMNEFHHLCLFLLPSNSYHAMSFLSIFLLDCITFLFSTDRFSLFLCLIVVCVLIHNMFWYLSFFFSSMYFLRPFRAIIWLATFDFWM